MSEIITLIKKEITLEWRQRYALNGMLLYVISTIAICYLSFNLNRNLLTPIVWNTLFWIILLFTAVNAIAKSFSREHYGRYLYHYMISSPQSIIISKIIYNSLLMLTLSLTALGFYILVMGNPVGNMTVYVLSVVLGSLGFASSLTLISAIASKADNSGSLMAILSFPMIIPMLLMVTKLAKNALDNLDTSVNYDEILVLLSIDAIVIGLSVILFPYLWRS